MIGTLGLNVGTVNGRATSAEAKLLSKDTYGATAHDNFSYCSVVRKMLSLSGHSRPDITYAVNSASCYMLHPRHSHELSVKRIGRCQRATCSIELITNPSSNLKIDCYPDTDFSGMYGHEKINDQACVKSRTGYITTVADCPVLWKSKIQIETALSTMEAEVIALTYSCRELLPIMDMVTVLAEAVGLP